MKKLFTILLIGTCLLSITACSDEPAVEEQNQTVDISSTEENLHEETSQEDTFNAEEKNIDLEQSTSKEYGIADEINLDGEMFNVYKIDTYNNELYLLAQNNIATAPYSSYENDYEGSIVEDYINEYVDVLEDKGYVIKDSGIIDVDDLYNLGFEDSDTLSGLPYKLGNSLEFVNYEDTYWVGGYCEYETRSWAYRYEKLDTYSCSNDECGIRPVIIIDPAEVDKVLPTVDADLKIEEIVNSDCAWICEGGLYNKYDVYYFDCENMIFKNIFESSELTQTNEFNMKFTDNNSVQIDGLRMNYEAPAELTIVDENTLRIRFINSTYDDDDEYLIKVK